MDDIIGTVPWTHLSRGKCKRDVTPLLTHWSYIFPALTCRYHVHGWSDWLHTRVSHLLHSVEILISNMQNHVMNVIISMIIDWKHCDKIICNPWWYTYLYICTVFGHIVHIVVYFTAAVLFRFAYTCWYWHVHFYVLHCIMISHSQITTMKHNKVGW